MEDRSAMYNNAGVRIMITRMTMDTRDFTKIALELFRGALESKRRLQGTLSTENEPQEEERIILSESAPTDSII